MRIYKLTFNQYTNSLMDTISCEKIQPRYITCRDGELLVGVDEFIQLKDLDLYGNGIKTVELIGYALVLEKKDRNDFENSSLEELFCSMKGR